MPLHLVLSFIHSSLSSIMESIQIHSPAMNDRAKFLPIQSQGCKTPTLYKFDSLNSSFHL